MGHHSAGAGMGFGSAFAGSLLNGGSLGDAFKAGALGAIVGGVTAGLTYGVGTLAEDHDWNWLERGLAHGSLQGGVTEATGGQFRHGFYAGFAAGASEQSIGKWAKDSPARGVTAAAVVGGTASALGGGKFANGAVSGAFTYLFNYLNHKEFKADIAFYDASVDDEDRLDARERMATHAAAVRYSDETKAVAVTNLKDIADYLESHPKLYDRILLISHGGYGDFGMGNIGLDANSAELASIRDALSNHGELYLMGCLTGAKQSYLNQLAGVLNNNGDSHISVYGTLHFNHIFRDTGIAFQTLHGFSDEKPLKGYPWAKSE